MLIYVIPLVIFLIALVYFKKRQDAQESDKATTQKTKAKKASSSASAKVSPSRTQPIEPPQKPQTTALNDDTRNKIQALIDERNFFSAEAQINQALKRDNTQHELYLYLLDIHILQKDEFAISQLLNHLRSLQLDDILTQAEAKKSNYDQSLNKSSDAIAYTAPVSEAPVVAKVQQNTADFDALMGTTQKVEDAPKTNLAFETAKKQPAVAAPEIKPLDFNMSFDSLAEKPPVTPQPAIEEVKPLEFGTTPAIEAELKVDAPATPVTTEIKPLDFSLDFAPAPTEVEKTATEATPLDFSFTTETAAEKATETAPTALSFDLSSIEPEPLVQEVTTAPTSTGVSFDISHVSSPNTSTADQTDPLVQSFPELLEVNEISLNLELAAQYIQLGAFESARELLDEKEAEYTPEQIDQVKLLRNQIAS